MLSCDSVFFVLVVALPTDEVIIIALNFTANAEHSSMKLMRPKFKNCTMNANDGIIG